MLIAEARVMTEHSVQYLDRLCRHVTKAAQVAPHMEAHVERSEHHGSITLGTGRCSLRAEPGVLTLRAEAPDPENLRDLERRVANRLETFGSRDRLKVIWTRARERTSEGGVHD